MFEYKSARHHMVESQIRTSDVTDPRVIKAFRTTPREAFVPKSKAALAYADTHIQLADDRHILRPRDFAKMVQAAEIKATDIVLDIACGRGYSTAIFASLAETVVALEDSDERVERATDILTQHEIMNAAVIKGDIKSGAAEHGPFDVVFVNGSVSSIPDNWKNQLNDGGRLVVVLDKGPVGHACVFTKSGNSFGEHLAFDASVPALMSFKPKPEFAF